MIDFETLKNGELVLGLVLTMIGAASAFLVWWDKRNRRYADTSAGRHTERLSSVEAKLAEIEKDTQALRSRMAVFESRLDGLATKSDIADLSTRVSRIEGTLERLAGNVDTLYRAALAAMPGDR